MQMGVEENNVLPRDYEIKKEFEVVALMVD